MSVVIRYQREEGDITNRVGILSINGIELPGVCEFEVVRKAGQFTRVRVEFNARFEEGTAAQLAVVEEGKAAK